MYSDASYSIDRLLEFSTRVFLHSGIPAGDAAQAAEVLITTDLWGIETHGVARLRSYYEMLNRGYRQRPELLHLSDYEIIGTYNAELRGLANYYCLAFDVKQKLNRLFYIGQKSLVKTLANKHRTKARNIILKLKQGKDYVYRYRVNGEEREIRLYTLKQMNSRPKMWQEANQLPNTHIFSERSEIIERMSARQCEYCGREDGYFEVHHIRKLSDIKEGKEKWQKRMIARRRKTLVLCVECHDLLHAGKLPSWRASIYERSGEPCAFKEASTVRRETHACTPEV